MVLILEQVLLLLSFAVIGYALCKTGKIENTNTKILSTLEVYLFLPATVFNTFSSNFTPTYLRQKYVLILASAVILVAVALAAHPVAKLLAKDDYQKKVFHYSLVVPNYGYMGYALAGGIFGSKMLIDVMVFALPLSLYTYTIGYNMLTKSPVSLKRLVNPVVLSILAGMCVGFSGIELPVVAANFLSKAAACMGPISMLLSGMVISQYKLTELFRNRESYLIALLRLVGIPCTVAIVLHALSLQTLIIPSITLLAMPCGLNTIVFPQLVGEDCGTGASLALVTSLLCVITIPLCLLVWG